MSETTAAPPLTFPAEWRDPLAAVRFMEDLRPGGPWTLHALYEPGAPRVDGDAGQVPTATFTTSKPMRSWIARRVGRANLYYAVNATTVPNKKAGKNEIAEGRYAHVEIDDADGVSLAKDPKRKAAIVAKLRTCKVPGPPTFIVDSGGGVQALWKLSTPVVPPDFDTIEALNYHFVCEFGGDPKTYDVSRILRLPGTVNLPDAGKRAKGRVPAPAMVVHSAPNASYDPSFEFDATEPPVKVEAPTLAFGEPIYTEDLGALATEYGLPDKLQQVIREGDPDLGDGSSSESTWYAVRRLLEHKVPNEVILGLLVDSTYPGIHNHVGKNPRGVDAYAERLLGRAIAEHIGQVRPASEDFPNLPEGAADPGERTEGKGKRVIVFEPYKLKDSKHIPPRPYLKQPAYIRKYATGTIALGAMGKTTFLVTEALELVTGQSLLGGEEPRGIYRVVFWNGEDPLEELDRKFTAACLHHGIAPEAIGDRLAVHSGRDLPIKIATIGKNGPTLVMPEVDALVAALLAVRADVLVIDPAISTHSVPENDNTAMEQWAQAWNLVAERANVAVHIASHTGKVRGRDSEAQDMRGASAMLNKLRYSRVLNRLSRDEAARIGINPNRAGLHVRIDDTAKANLQPPGASAQWFKLESVDLGNADFKTDGLLAKSDRMGVAVAWSYPDFVVDVRNEQMEAVLAAMGGKLWRKTWTDPNKGEWVGVPIAAGLALDTEDQADRKRIRTLIERWEASGVLIVAKGKNGQRQEFEGYKAGQVPEEESTEGYGE